MKVSQDATDYIKTEKNNLQLSLEMSTEISRTSEVVINSLKEQLIYIEEVQQVIFGYCYCYLFIIFYIMYTNRVSIDYYVAALFTPFFIFCSQYNA